MIIISLKLYLLIKHHLHLMKNIKILIIKTLIIHQYCDSFIMATFSKSIVDYYYYKYRDSIFIFNFVYFNYIHNKY